MWPASSTWLARTIPSSADWPVPWRSLSARSVRASLTASTGQRSSPRARAGAAAPARWSSPRCRRSAPRASRRRLVGGHQQVGAVVDRHLRARRRASRGRGAAYVSRSSPWQRPHLDAVLDDERRGHVVLRPTAGWPSTARRVRPARGQRQQQVRRLGGDVQARRRPGSPRAAARRRTARGSARAPASARPPRRSARAPVGQRQVGDVVRREPAVRHASSGADCAPQ